MFATSKLNKAMELCRETSTPGGYSGFHSPYRKEMLRVRSVLICAYVMRYVGGFVLKAKEHEDNVLHLLDSQSMMVFLQSSFSVHKEVRWEVDTMDY